MRVTRTAVLAIGSVFVLGVYGVLVWNAPRIVVGSSRLRAITDAGQRATVEYNARVLMVSLAGAVVVVVGLAFTARTYALNQRGQTLLRRGQANERFSRALERLGSPELYVRIGGVHALEHLQADDPDHHTNTQQVLIAFIRERTPRTRTHTSPQPGRWMHPPTPHKSEPEALPVEPDADVQAALTLVTRASTQTSVRTDFQRLHLGGADLYRAHLYRAHLMGADLMGADLGGANLGDANLRGANLRRANLLGANLGRADLTGADLRRANLLGSELSHANLTGADLRGTHLIGVELSSANLRSANLHGANLSRAVLSRTNLTGADLRGADLNGADLNGADLSRVIFDDSTRWPSGYPVPPRRPQTF
ncbi:hypothetical protein F4553_000054 [Allocatelliglobosispora scoriae]|uniref:Pentapeptide repeat-containing protein n=1 Tax=Allocatelliglobosispora scoriae TaxID=643052 RepID=A0A841BGB8_9ACTN|nr:pentapeptide repeat-containing protein [Allocatelliglobosispora scoriae]MBB5866675.1 hypothetical protein [Allocatelliglobosispora scoriae]